MTYSEKLKDPRWQRKRLEIFERDNFECQCCHNNSQTLNVHHLIYHNNKNPWEYPNSELMTLCEDCHEFEYLNRKTAEESLITFFKENKFLCPDLDNIQGYIIDHPNFIKEINDYCLSVELRDYNEWKARQSGKE